jgi:hypothetical protein
MMDTIESLGRMFCTCTFNLKNHVLLLELPLLFELPA